MSNPQLGSEARPLRVAVIGSGPSAFYAVEALFKVEGLVAHCDVFDRLPTPYGLVRGGVAPDHQKIKSVVRVYEKIAANERFRFFGNVKLGRDLQVQDLLDHYHQVIYAFGNESDRKMNIPGEDLPGVHSATEFVGWYNGHPDHVHRSFDLSKVERVAVVGNGNVSMDVTRVLVEDPDELAKTDITDAAVAALRASAVKEVVVLGRRGPAQAAFSPKEIQEIAAIERVHLEVSPEDAQLDEISQNWLDQQSGRSARRNVDFLQEQAQISGGEAEKVVRCRFLVSPVELKGGEHLKGIRIQRSELHLDDRGTPRPKGVDSFEELDVQLVFKAVGYRGIPVEGVPFDEGWGTVPNDEGRVQTERGGTVLPRQYVVGWAKRGPTGLIGTNSPDSKDTVARMVEDLPTVDADVPAETAIVELLQSRGVDVVTYQDWQNLDAHEKAEGEKVGKPRQKITSVDEMMAVVRAAR